MVIRHTFFNLLGLGLPLVVAVFTIPVLIHALGAANFGVLTLIWAVVSYFGLLDLGLGRTLTMQLALALSRGDSRRVGPMMITALMVMAVLGVVVGGALIAFAASVVKLIEAVPDPDQTMAAVRAMGWALPAITLTSGLRGMLEARHAFGVVNLIRLPMGIFTFVGPMLVVIFLEPRLDWIAWALMAGRWAACLMHAWFAWKLLPPDHGKLRFEAAEMRALLSIGGWLTVSNIVSSLMGYADRFIIAGLVSATAVAYYATPYELATKLWIVPGALTAVLFPTFTTQISKDVTGGAALYRQSVVALALLLLPVCATLAIFAEDMLRIWINAEFAVNSAPLLQIFALGVLMNAVATIPFTLIQSAGYPRWTAIIHLTEIIPFLGLLWWATAQFGILGAATTWLLRIAIDTVVLFLANGYLLRLGWRAAVPSQLSNVIFLTVLSAAITFLESLILRAFGLLFVSLLCAMFLLKEPAIRVRVNGLFSKLLG